MPSVGLLSTMWAEYVLQADLAVPKAVYYLHLPSFPSIEDSPRKSDNRLDLQEYHWKKFIHISILE